MRDCQYKYLCVFWHTENKFKQIKLTNRRNRNLQLKLESRQWKRIRKQTQKIDKIQHNPKIIRNFDDQLNSFLNTGKFSIPTITQKIMVQIQQIILTLKTVKMSGTHSDKSIITLIILIALFKFSYTQALSHFQIIRIYIIYLLLLLLIPMLHQYGLIQQIQQIFHCPCMAMEKHWMIQQIQEILDYSKKLSGFVWRSFDGHCVRNCSRSVDPYAIAASLTNINQCDCQTGFIFDSSYNRCVRDCSVQKDPHSIGIIPPNYGECRCQSSYFWRTTDSRCVRNFSKEVDPYALQTNNATISECTCMANCSWNSSTNSCRPNSSNPILLARSSIPKLSQTANQQQHCQTGLEWNETEKVCRRICVSLDNIDQSQISNNPNECVCLGGYLWDKVGVKCVIVVSANTSAFSGTPKINLNKQNQQTEEIEIFNQNWNQDNGKEYESKHSQSPKSNTGNTLIFVLAILGTILTFLLFGSIGIRLASNRQISDKQTDKNKKNREEVGSASSKEIQSNLETEQNV